MYRRYQFRLPVPVTEDRGDAEGQLLGFAKNISAGGLFISAKDPPAVGSVFKLKFKLPGGETTVACQGEVVWRRERDPYSAYDSGMGVRFVNLDYRFQAVIDSFVREKGGRNAAK